MKKIFIVANWKSNKTSVEARDWLKQFSLRSPHLINREIIVCPPLTLLPLLTSYIVNLDSGIKVGAQDSSPFEMGAYTGEVNAEQLKEFATYAIIGHSERRNNFSESDELLAKKVQMALHAAIIPIFCVQGIETPIPQGVEIAAYEPISAIGTGQPDSPENAEMVAKTIKEKYNVQHVLYGGSVNKEDVRSFTEKPNIDGVLVGGASLDAKHFMHIIENA